MELVSCSAFARCPCMHAGTYLSRIRRVVRGVIDSRADCLHVPCGTYASPEASLRLESRVGAVSLTATQDSGFG